MKKLLKRAIPLIIGSIIGIIAGVSHVKSGFPNFANINPIFGIFALLLSFLSQIILHEFGHFIFGKLTGMQFYSFRIGFLAIERENHAISLKFYKNLGYLGLCIMLPGRQKKTNKGLMLYLAGGLIMNLLPPCPAVFFPTLFTPQPSPPFFYL